MGTQFKALEHPADGADAGGGHAEEQLAARLDVLEQLHVGEQRRHEDSRLSRVASVAQPQLERVVRREALRQLLRRTCARHVTYRITEQWRSRHDNTVPDTTTSTTSGGDRRRAVHTERDEVAVYEQRHAAGQSDRLVDAARGHHTATPVRVGPDGRAHQSLHERAHRQPAFGREALERLVQQRQHASAQKARRNAHLQTRPEADQRASEFEGSSRDAAGSEHTFLRKARGMRPSG